MKTPATLDSLHDLLSGFIHKQEIFNKEMIVFKNEMLGFQNEQIGFNAEMREFKNEQLAFNAEMREFKNEQLAFRTTQLSFNEEQRAFNIRIEGKLDREAEDNRANHHLSHRMLMQAFENISDVRRDIDDQTEPWKKK